MGMLTNILMFMVMASIVLYMLGSGSILTNTVACIQYPGAQIGYNGTVLDNGNCSFSSIFGGTSNPWSLLNMFIVGGTLAGIVAVAGSLITLGPDKTLTIVGLIFFVGAFVTMPLDLMNAELLRGLPVELAIGIEVMLFLTFIIGVISWGRGGSTP